MCRKAVSLLVLLCLVLTLTLPARAAKAEDYASELISYYYHHQDAAEDVIWDILNQMAQVDADQAAVWKNIMADWAWVNSGMPVSENVLPDGLPEDESLCIVVLGFGLAEDGSMKEELIDRLVVALSSALKYPNAWIAVTGGQTSNIPGITEAGQMAAWLQKKGVEKNRILVENQSLSTTANAVNVYKLLNKSYPQVDTIAVVTSDYHLAWGSALFTAVSNYNFGYHAGNPIDVVAGAACDTGMTADTLLQQAWGISQITGVPFAEHAAAPALYPVDRPPETTEAAPEEEKPASHWKPFWDPAPAQPQPQAEQAAEEPEPKWPVYLLLPLAAAAIYVFCIPKKPRKKREKPQWKWE